MKKIITFHFYIITLFAFRSLIGQPCANNTSTDWLNPKPNDGTYKSNYFNWQQQNFSWFDKLDNTVKTLSSPFWTTHEYTRAINHEAESDFYVIDGWELLKRDMGYMNDNVTPNYINPSPAPYIILYNKYTSVMRVLGYLPVPEVHQSVSIVLKFRDQQKLSGLFNQSSAKARALDKNTPLSSISIFSLSPYVSQGAGGFFYADFQLAYDPCTCIFESGIHVLFEFIDNHEIKLAGRSLGLSYSIEDAAGGSLYGGENAKSSFLTSVLTDNTNSDNNLDQGGSMFFYKSLPELVNDYQTSAAELASNTQIRDGVIGFYQKVKSTSSLGDEKYAKNLEKVAGITDFLGIKTNNDKVSPSAVLSEIALKGTLTTRTVGSGYDFYIENPGSLGSTNAPEFTNSGASAYTPYNEVLGVFALLNTPKVKRYINLDVNVNDDNYYSQGFVKICGSCNVTEKSYIQIDPAYDFKYFFNPILNINWNKSTIRAALVIENLSVDQSKSPLGDNPKVNNNFNLNVYPVYTSSAVPDDPNDSKDQFKPQKDVYISDFVSPKDLKNIVVANYINYPYGNSDKITPYFRTALKPYIKLILDLEFNTTNRQGLPNHSSFIATYPCEFDPIITDDFLGLENKLFNLQLDLAVTDSKNNSSQKALEKINISNPYINNPSLQNIVVVQSASATPSVPRPGMSGSLCDNNQSLDVVCMAGKEVILGAGCSIKASVDNSSMIYPPAVNASNLCPVFYSSMTLKVGNNGLLPYSTTTPLIPTPQNINYVQSFCNNQAPEVYKANSPAARYSKEQKSSKIQTEHNTNNSLSAYPNPFNKNTTITYNIPEKTNITIYINDSFGRRIALLVDGETKEAGKHSIQFDADNLASGIYFYTLQTNTYKETQRLVIVK